MTTASSSPVAQRMANKYTKPCGRSSAAPSARAIERPFGERNPLALDFRSGGPYPGHSRRCIKLCAGHRNEIEPKGAMLTLPLLLVILLPLGVILLLEGTGERGAHGPVR